MKEEHLFNEHKKLHEGVPENQCVYCKNQFQRQQNLKAHVQIHLKKMLKIEPYQCEFCGRTFLTKGSVASHIANVHSEVRSFECDTCGMKFKRKPHLERHLISHVCFHPNL